MPAKPSGKVKTRTVRETQKNGDIYVFERKEVYNPEKKYNEVVEARLVGKIPKGTEAMVPTRPKRPKGETREAYLEDTIRVLEQEVEKREEAIRVLRQENARIRFVEQEKDELAQERDELARKNAELLEKLSRIHGDQS